MNDAHGVVDGLRQACHDIRLAILCPYKNAYSRFRDLRPTQNPI